jgi:putative transposase
MARLPRYALPGIPHHVIQRGNNRSAMFAGTADYLFFRECLAIGSLQHSCLIHAYVLMTNHVHLLATAGTPNGLSRFMQSVGCRYVHYFNRTYGRTGTLWEGRYRATPIDTDRYLLACYRYIELNPVRAGMAEDPAAYPWSSYRANALGYPDPLVSVHQRFEALGADVESRRLAYRSLFDHAIGPDTIQKIRETTNNGWVLGDNDFSQAIAAVSNRRSRSLGRGRPKKGV